MLKEYYNYVKDISNEKLVKLKNDNIVPEWVTLDYLNTYFWLYYSVSKEDTNWKKSMIAANIKFSQLNSYNLLNYFNILN